MFRRFLVIVVLLIVGFVGGECFVDAVSPRAAALRRSETPGAASISRPQIGVQPEARPARQSTVAPRPTLGRAILPCQRFLIFLSWSRRDPLAMSVTLTAGRTPINVAAAGSTADTSQPRSEVSDAFDPSTVHRRPGSAPAAGGLVVAVTDDGSMSVLRGFARRLPVSRPPSPARCCSSTWRRGSRAHPRGTRR